MFILAVNCLWMHKLINGVNHWHAGIMSLLTIACRMRSNRRVNILPQKFVDIGPLGERSRTARKPLGEESTRTHHRFCWWPDLVRRQGFPSRAIENLGLKPGAQSISRDGLVLLSGLSVHKVQSFFTRMCRHTSTSMYQHISPCQRSFQDIVVSIPRRFVPMVVPILSGTLSCTFCPNFPEIKA